MLQGIIIFTFIIGLTVLVGVAMCLEDNDNKTNKENRTNKEKYLYSEKEFLSLLKFCENYPLYATRMEHAAFQSEILACKEKHRYYKENGLINENFYTLLCEDLLFYISEKDKEQINYGKIEQKN